MNRKEFMRELSKRTGFTQVALNKIAVAAFEIICENLTVGDEVIIKGFGTFKTRERGSRRLITPKGEVKVTPPTRFPVFKPGKEFKDRV